MQEHRRHTEKCDLQRSAIAEHSVLQDHRIICDDARVLDMEEARRPRKIKEAMDIAIQGRQWPLMNKGRGWSEHNSGLHRLF